MKWIVFLPFVVACTSAVSPAPYDGGDHMSAYPTCDAIIKQCHPFDVGKGPIHECHDVGHGAMTDQDCQAKKDECFRICVTDSGVSMDAAKDAPSE